jgi:hypothetical protein
LLRPGSGWLALAGAVVCSARRPRRLGRRLGTRLPGQPRVRSRVRVPVQLVVGLRVVFVPVSVVVRRSFRTERPDAVGVLMGVGSGNRRVYRVRIRLCVIRC